MLLSSSSSPRIEVVRKICSAPQRNCTADLGAKRRCPLSENAYVTATPSFSSSHGLLSTYDFSFVLPIPSKVNLTQWTEKSQNWSSEGELWDLPKCDFRCSSFPFKPSCLWIRCVCGCGRHNQPYRVQGPEITWMSLDQNNIMNSVDSGSGVIQGINMKSVLLITYETFYFTLKHL